MKVYYIGDYNKTKKQIEVAEVYINNSCNYIPRNVLSTKEEAFAFVRDNHAEVLHQRILNTKDAIDDLEKQLEWAKAELQSSEEELKDFEEYLSDIIEKLLEDPTDEAKNV